MRISRSNKLKCLDCDLKNGIYTRISSFQKRHEKFSGYYVMENALYACINIHGLMDELVFQHIPEEWRLFVDSSKARVSKQYCYTMETLNLQYL